MTEVLRAPYLRYVDDFALFHDDPAVVAEWRDRIARFLEGRRLRLHPRKTEMSPTSAPACFPGLRTRARGATQSAGGQRASLSKSIAWLSGPLASGNDRSRVYRCSRSSMDCACFARRHMALTPFDLRGGLVRSGLSRRSLNGPLWSGPPRRLLEQQSEEPPRREPQQEQPRQPEQQQRLPLGQNVFRRSRRDQGPGGRACYVQDRS